MGLFESILSTNTFSDWLTKWNAFSGHANPLGTSIVDFHNIRVSGDIYYGTTTASVLFKKEIETYYLDNITPPTIGSSFNRKYAEFSPTSTNIIAFDFNFSNFHDITDDRYISLGYAMSSAQSANIILHADYYIGKEGVLLSSTPTGTSRATITVNTSQNVYDLTDELTILGADISSREDWCYVKLMRIGADGADSHNGYFNLFDIKII